MKKIIILLFIAVAHVSFSQTKTITGKLKVTETPLSINADTLLSISTDGVVSKSNVKISDFTDLNNSVTVNSSVINSSSKTINSNFKLNDYAGVINDISTVVLTENIEFIHNYNDGVILNESLFLVKNGFSETLDRLKNTDQFVRFFNRIVGDIQIMQFEVRTIPQYIPNLSSEYTCYLVRGSLPDISGLFAPPYNGLFYYNFISEKTEPIVILGTGQSGMNGIVTGVNTGLDKDINPAVEVWNDITNAWEIADLYKYPFGERVSVNGDDISGNNNIIFHTAKRIQEQTGKLVRILFKAYSGTSIKRWLATDSNPAAWNGVTDIITQSGVNNINAVFWYQGEADSNSTVLLAETYSIDLVIFKKQLENINKNIKFISTELANQYRLNDVFYKYPQYEKYISDPYFTVATTKNLNYIDGIHLTGESVVSLSYEYADRFFSLPNTSNSFSKKTFQTLDINGSFIENNADYIELDIESSSKNFKLPQLDNYNEIKLRVIGSNTNYAQFQFHTGEGFADGSTAASNRLYGNGSEITIISTPLGHKITSYNLKTEGTQEITGGTSALQLTHGPFSPKYIIVSGSTGTANVNNTLPQHEEATDFIIERKKDCTNPVNILNASGAEIDNAGAFFTIAAGERYRFYYSENIGLYKWQKLTASEYTPSDIVYSTDWNNSILAPTQNAVYDELELIYNNFNFTGIQTQSVIDQTTSVVNTETDLTSSLHSFIEGMAIGNNKEFIANSSGKYLFKLSYNLENTSASTGKIYLWLVTSPDAISFTEIPNTLTQNTLLASEQKQLSKTHLLDLSAGDRITYRWATDNTGIEYKYIPSPFSSLPNAPSVSLSIVKIGN